MPLHKRLFLVLVLLLPTQLAYHFWPQSALVFGIRVDYLAPTVYLTDILVALVLVTWFYAARPKLKLKSFKYFLLFTFYFLLNSLFIAQNQPAASYKLLKLAEVFLLGFYVFHSRFTIHDSRFTPALSIAVIYTSIIGIAQFLLGRTVGGPLWFLGERTFNLGTPGIALQTIGGQEYLRAYSTFSHPNSFAGFLLISGLLLLPSKTRLARATVGAGIIAFILTFSQGAWLAAILVGATFLWTAWKKSIPPRWLLFNLTLVPVALTAAVVFLDSSQLLLQTPEEISLRMGLGQAAQEMVATNPLFGVGLNNFISRLPEFSEIPGVSWWLQPVHNIFLLVLAELGIIGLGAFLWFLWLLFNKLNKGDGAPKLMLAFFAILITGTLDHYWLTLQQNMLLGALFVGLVFSKGFR